jgi:hypothetical protein
MTAKEKAEELYDKMFDKVEDVEVECGRYCMGGSFNRHTISKQCALIACEEVLGYMGADRGTEFWVEVKNEIEKL